MTETCDWRAVVQRTGHLDRSPINSNISILYDEFQYLVVRPIDGSYVPFWHARYEVVSPAMA
jgi:hypothetical protein